MYFNCRSANVASTVTTHSARQTCSLHCSSAILMSHVHSECSVEWRSLIQLAMTTWGTQSALHSCAACKLRHSNAARTSGVGLAGTAASQCIVEPQPIVPPPSQTRITNQAEGPEGVQQRVQQICSSKWEGMQCSAIGSRAVNLKP